MWSRHLDFLSETTNVASDRMSVNPGYFHPNPTARSSGSTEPWPNEFLYSFTFRSETERRRRLDRWVHDYNHHRNHTAVGGPPASRVHNVCGSYS